MGGKRYRDLIILVFKSQFTFSAVAAKIPSKSLIQHHQDMFHPFLFKRISLFPKFTTKSYC